MNCLFVYGELVAKESLEEVRRLQQRAQLTEFTFQLQGERGPQLVSTTANPFPRKRWR